MSEVVKVDVGWLTLPASDVNFTAALHRANEATLRAALEKLAGKPGHKTREVAIRRQLGRLVSDDLDQTRDTAERQDRGLAMEMAPLVAEREERLSAEEKQVEREQMIAQSYQLAGRIQAFTFIEKVVTTATLMQLKQIKETKVYRDLPNIGTWEKYCDYLGLDRHTIDERLRQLEIFGSQFLETATSLGVGFKDLRKLRQISYDGESFTIADDGKTVIIEGESITLSEESAPELEAALEKLLEKNRTLADRNKKLEKEFKAAVKEETNGLEIEKKALLKEVDRLKAFDPEEQDREWSVEQMAEIEKAAGEFVILVQKFIIDPRFKDDRHLQARVSGHLQEAALALHDQRNRLDEIIDMFND